MSHIEHKATTIELRGLQSHLLVQLPRFRARILVVGHHAASVAESLAKQGHDLVAVSDEVEESYSAAFMSCYRDSFPDLDKLFALQDRYDLIIARPEPSHLQEANGNRALKKLSGLLEPGGMLVITFRPEVVASNVLLDTAKALGLESDDSVSVEGPAAALALRSSDDGTGAFPILRNILVNDAMFSTYKLGLLRVLLRMAAEASGLARNGRDGNVHLPMGLATLYWLKAYRPLIEHDMPQMAHGTCSFRDEVKAFARISSVYGLHLGAQFTGETAQRLHTAMRSVRGSITQIKGPLRRTTWVDTDQPIFDYNNASTRGRRRRVSLTPDYLWSFGHIIVPPQIWKTLTRHWIWIEPAVVRAWIQLMQTWERNRPRPEHEYRLALKWQGLDARDTAEVRSILEDLITDGQKTQCIWSGRSLPRLAGIEVDHCIPYSRWGNNSLWNLVPASSTANQAKGDRLPSPQLLLDAKPRFYDWWQRAYLDRSRHQRFFMEAQMALPGVAPGNDTDLDQVYDAMTHQVRRIRRDQQIEVWEYSA